MPKARIQWAPDALYNLRSNHGPTRAWVEGVASGMAAAAGEGFEWSSQQGARNPQGRWRAIVYAATPAAFKKNAQENTLVRVLGSVKG
ncbi:hypothetical protein [Prescottella equi]|uniref:hypothetical protein n=1 Tax=Rhodococcus hoagii TaxID=43767 RepID=UPI00197F5087|nr:hypothetical protein [Prescottella equi]MBM4711089.1 hypothetical protein [Prescottella equi]NKU16368.1 hypothetical protein [Prescottella equi]NKU16381.1 hypothetical protein [Prescottella equi]NKU91688.1 hypothetical protein [Prescottella equi]NKV46365.1 hypothetical protein [Prescottella equi]